MSTTTTSRPLVTVTAPTSSIGRQVVERLGRRAVDLRVIARDPSKLPAGLDAEVVEGSHAAPAVLDQALDGADALFWLTPPDPTSSSMIEAFVGFAAPAVPVLGRRPQLRVVGITALGRSSDLADRAGYVTGSLAVDEMIGGSGVHYRALAMPSFMDNLLRMTSAIAAGRLPLPYAPDLELPSVSTGDIADVASELLSDPTWTGVERRPVLGAADISPRQMAKTITDVVGRDVELVTVDLDRYRDQLVDAAGFSPAMAAAMRDMAAAKIAGIDSGVERTDANTTDTTFERWVRTVLRPALERR